jgi:hypothetical protein
VWQSDLLLETNFAPSSAVGNGRCLQLMFAELPKIEAANRMSRRLEDMADSAEFRGLKRSKLGGSRKPSGARAHMRAEKLSENGSCFRCFVMKERCDMKTPCGSCVAAVSRPRLLWKLPCSRGWLEHSNAVSVPSWSWACHRTEIMNSKLNNKMSVDTLRRHMEMVYGIVAPYDPSMSLNLVMDLD